MHELAYQNFEYDIPNLFQEPNFVSNQHPLYLPDLVIENYISAEVVYEIKSRVDAVIHSDGVTMFSDRQGLPRRLERFTYMDARFIALMEDVGECVKAVTE